MARHVIVPSIERADRELVERLGHHGVATVHEAMGRAGLLRPGIVAIQRGARVAGSAITVSCQTGDNLMVHAAVETVKPGDVLVISTTSPSHDGMFGELLATSLQVAGCRGLVTEAGVRDSEELRQMEFPVWARAIHAQGTVKATGGSVNVPVVCGGVSVRPGDVVVADDDGVVVVPRALSREVADAARAREAREEETRRRLQQGELGLDIYGLRERLSDLGVEYLDGREDS